MTFPYSISLVTLLKGIVYDTQKETWENLLQYEVDVKKYYLAIGLDLYVDRSEGFAFLKQMELEDDPEIPRLIEKRHMSFMLTLVCLTLRKYLLENDAAGTSARAIITKQQIVERMKPFLPPSTDEAKQLEKIDTQIRKVIDEGFLRGLENEKDTYEVRRIIRAFIDADKVEEILEKLKGYKTDKE
ncbi:MAG: DUF4194 domain-containing protein [Cyclobacteriaceae bacterium]